MGSGDRYYGYGPIAGVCTAVITNLFSPVPSPPANVAKTPASGLRNEHGYLSPPPSAESSPQMGTEFASANATVTPPKPQWHTREGIDTPPHSPLVSETGKEIPELMDFIAYALYRTRLPTPIIHSALVLLTRLKKLYPSARGTSSSPHRLFLSALMLASKMSMDDTYSNRSWCIVGQQLFALAEVNRMERELFGFLNWNCCVSGPELDAWTDEWLSPGGVVGNVAAQDLPARRSSEDRKRRRSSTTGSSKDVAQPQQKHSPPFTMSRPDDSSSDRHRQATDAARALLHPSSAASAVDSPVGPTERRASAPTIAQSMSAPAVFDASRQTLVAPPSPDSPPRPRSSSQRRAWSTSRVNDSMHMRQASDSSMRSLASSGCYDSSEASTSGSVCCSSVSSPRSYHGSDSPASVGPPRTPEEATTDAATGHWSAKPVPDAPCDDATDDISSRQWYAGRPAQARSEIPAGAW